VPPGERLCPSGGPLGRGQTAGRGHTSRRKARPPARPHLPDEGQTLGHRISWGRGAVLPWGGYGIINPSPVGRFYRDAKILEIGEGTSEVQRMLIARELGFGG